MKIADVIDQQKQQTDYQEQYQRNRWNYLLKNHVISKLLIKKIYRFWYRVTGVSIKNKKLREKYFIEEWEKTVDNHINRWQGIQEKLEKFQRIIRKREQLL